MAERVGLYVVETLEHAGERFLAPSAPDAFRVFLMQVGAAGTLHAYDESAAYWERVQVILDFFFTAAERAQICERLLRCGTLRAAPEFQGFLASALAECRLQATLPAAMPIGSTSTSTS